MTAPRVSVVMATYNWSSVLPFSIASTLEQTFSDFELIVVGDGCTDDSERVVRDIRDTRVRWINLPSRSGHQSAPNNEGIRVARGELIAYHGHDDLWLPHHLEAMVAAIDGGADVAYSLGAWVPPQGAILPWTQAPTCVVHRRAIVDAIGGWRDYRELVLAPDIEFWERMRAAGFAWTFVPRLTAVKLPAAVRRNVYRDRPSHEQAAWLARIRGEADLEAKLLAQMVFDRAKPLFAQSKRRATLLRIARLLARPWRWPGVLWRRMPGRKGAAVSGAIRFKGAGE